ncbi:MAG: sugar phosphate isomerase/epimerase family protein [Planctomycetaceae bacterium]
MVDFDVAISELTTSRWDLQQEASRAADLGFAAIALWRPKVSDVGTDRVRRLLLDAGLRVSSLQWAGGFTGGDGRSFDESVDDAVDAIGMAAAVEAPVLVVHSGCRGGHTKSHARRLLAQACEQLAPVAARAGVVLAIKPVHPVAAAGCSFLSCLDEALGLVESAADPSLRLALDLWHFGHDEVLPALLPRLAAATAVVQVADRCGGPPAADADRLPAGHGCLPLESLVAGLLAHGFQGPCEFDPVGEEVEILGYEGVWREMRLVSDSWGRRLGAGIPLTVSGAGDGPRGPRSASYRLAAAGSRRSHASSHSGSSG